MKILRTFFGLVVLSLFVAIVPAAAQGACDGLPPRLINGDMAEVAPGIALDLRSVGSPRGQVLRQIYGGAVVQVTNNPFCSTYGQTWVRVDYNGTTGWVLESASGQYFLIPISTGSGSSSGPSGPSAPGGNVPPVADCSATLTSRLFPGDFGMVVLAPMHRRPPDLRGDGTCRSHHRRRAPISYSPAPDRDAAGASPRAAACGRA